MTSAPRRLRISASHNPFEYNGIKFFDGFGYKLPDETEDKIEECMLKDERAALQSRPTGAAIGTISTWTDLQQEYADFIFRFVRQFIAKAIEELDAVVFKRIMRGRNHDACVHMMGPRQVGNGRSRNDAYHVAVPTG